MQPIINPFNAVKLYQSITNDGDTYTLELSSRVYTANGVVQVMSQHDSFSGKPISLYATIFMDDATDSLCTINIEYGKRNQVADSLQARLLQGYAEHYAAIGATWYGVESAPLNVLAAVWDYRVRKFSDSPRRITLSGEIISGGELYTIDCMITERPHSKPAIKITSGGLTIDNSSKAGTSLLVSLIGQYGYDYLHDTLTKAIADDNPTRLLKSHLG